MGGFMINGIGAADSYYPITNVGTFYCKDCRKEQAFQLMELKMKIRILYIPTVSINTKYAVVCPKCKTGYYVEEQVKNNIVDGKTKVNVTSDGLEFIEKMTEPLSTETVPLIETKVSEEHKTTDENNDSSVSTTVTDFTDSTDSEDTVREPSDENVSPDTNIHISGSDFSISEIDLPRIIRKQCPTCGMFFREDMEACPICCCRLIVKEYKIGKE